MSHAVGVRLGRKSSILSRYVNNTLEETNTAFPLEDIAAELLTEQGRQRDSNTDKLRGGLSLLPSLLETFGLAHAAMFQLLPAAINTISSAEVNRKQAQESGLQFNRGKEWKGRVRGSQWQGGQVKAIVSVPQFGLHVHRLSTSPGVD